MRLVAAFAIVCSCVAVACANGSQARSAGESARAAHLPRTIVFTTHGIEGAAVAAHGSITAGSRSLLLDSPAQFANHQYVSVEGAGNSGGKFTAMIRRGAGSTALVLDSPAKASVSNAAVSSDDTPTIDSVFSSARTYRQKHPNAGTIQVVITSGDYNLASPVNATGLDRMLVLCNGNLMGNSGGIALDASGSTNVTWEQMTVSIPNGMPSFDGTVGTPSTVGILLSGASNNTFINPHIEVMQHGAANGGSGSVGIYVSGSQATYVYGGRFFGDNGAVVTGSNLFRITSPFSSAAAQATEAETLLNTELDGGYGYPLVVENSSNDIFKIYAGGGVNGQLPTNGQLYAIRVAGSVASSSFIGNVEVWPDGIRFDAASEPLSFADNAVSLDLPIGSGDLMALGRAGDSAPIQSFNGNDFRIGSPAANYIGVNDRNFPAGSGDGNTFEIRSFQTLDSIWTSPLANTIRMLN